MLPALDHSNVVARVCEEMHDALAGSSQGHEGVLYALFAIHEETFEGRQPDDRSGNILRIIQWMSLLKGSVSRQGNVR